MNGSKMSKKYIICVYSKNHTKKTSTFYIYIYSENKRCNFQCEAGVFVIVTEL